MKKVILSKSTNPKEMANGSVYHQRKKMEPQIKELFKVLFTIPDKDLVNRVIAAINNINTPQCACQNKKTITQSAATQTVEEETTAPAGDIRIRVPSSEDSLKTGTDATKSNEPATKQEQQVFKRKKRRRKVCVPQAQHVSQAQALRTLQPKLLKRDYNKTNTKNTDQEKTEVKRLRSDSLSSLQLDDIDVDMLCHQLCRPAAVTLDDIKKIMALEFCTAEDMKDGLLPIHTAIVENDAKRLSRQLFVWKDKKVDINELLTDDNQDCLQLAIIENSLPEIISILLATDLNINCVDEHSNTIIHLAILNDVDVQSLELLMKRIDLETLLKVNDHGHSPLHLAVRHDRYLHAEILLNMIDKRTLGKAIYERQPTENDPITLNDRRNHSKEQKIFLKYYEDACDCLDMLNSPIVEAMTKNDIKVKLLDLGEVCSGNTALFHALEDRMEHFIYFLLAHLSDPRCLNHCGHDAKSYFVEFSKSLSLSLKVDRTMEKVIAFITKHLK